jgi:fructokinase
VSRELWGIDLGGTKIEGAIVDPSLPDRAVSRVRIATEADQGYEHIVEQIARLVKMMAKDEKRPGAIGIGTPGAVEPSTGLMKNCNTVCLNGRALPADLKRALGCDVVIANDANCFALAEAKMGAARGANVVVGLIVGSGVGSGIVVHGRVLEGLHGIAGEWGHNPVCGETTRCYCGRRGCVETVISGPALERFYDAGRTVRLEEIVARRDGTATVERLREKFGEAIAALINILDPDAIVIGGGVGNVPVLYEEATREAVRRHLFNPELRTKFLRPELGDSAGVFGAALLTA